MKHQILSIAVCSVAATNALADLSLTINSLTANDFSFTVSGTFDSDVGGDQRTWLAVKPNWSTNFGVNVPWIDDSVGFTDLGDTAFTINENSILINGLVPTQSIVAASGQEWGDSFYFDAGVDITAGMTVSGTLSVSLGGVFDSSLSASDFELLSGFDNTASDWYRQEAVAPAPMTASLLALGGVCAIGRRRR
ncbi:hypothetical protein MNBD_PLANCTO03-1698 [hydrothermal vent metagenome]|uniref:Uncharacterized protein n=1 Tax=hydrothermal vent metagenome TaxID=652676 RepID=A0A3B1D0F8_9ZZZZ